MPGLEIHGIQEDELGREVELWAEDGDAPNEDHEEEGGPGPPLRALCTFPFVFSFCGRTFIQGTQGRRRGAPHHDRASWSGSGKGLKMYKRPPLPWPFGPHATGYK